MANAMSLNVTIRANVRMGSSCMIFQCYVSV